MVKDPWVETVEGRPREPGGDVRAFAALRHRESVKNYFYRKQGGTAN
jgi:hypothetical protein